MEEEEETVSFWNHKSEKNFFIQPDAALASLQDSPLFILSFNKHSDHILSPS